jgi:DeoR/GlpR family transcriptional regulator of sugar metabolism
MIDKNQSLFPMVSTGTGMNLRQTQILELIERDERISISDIREAFGVSEMTVRRDLALLEERGYVTRIHGGVVARKKLFFDSSFSQRRREHEEEKKIIARTAVSFVEPGENIILDTGTTTLYIAEELVRLDMVATVATTSLAVASTLFNSSIDVLIFGGFLRREIPDLFGPLTERNLKEFHAHKLFMGCDGLTPEEGFFTSDLHISKIEESLVGRADRVIVVTDSSKFGRKSFVRIAETDAVHTIITDSGIQARFLRDFEKRGVEVLVAEYGE